MLEYDFKESIGYSVAMAYRALRKALDAELGHYGITFAQWLKPGAIVALPTLAIANLLLLAQLSLMPHAVVAASH